MAGSAADIAVGCRVRALKAIDGGHFWHEAEVMALRRARATGAPEYYVHFVDFNKRLDEWVPAERIDAASVRPGGDAAARKAPVPKKSVAKKAPAKAPRKSSARRDRRAPSKPQKEEREETEPDAQQTDASQTALEQEMEKLRRGGSMTHRMEEVSRVKNFDSVEIGRHVVHTWYFSPYPEELLRGNADARLFLCEFCLSFFGKREELARHREKCDARAPVGGREIYRSGKHAFWELDGHRNKTYCRNLCLLSKLFLDHKTLFYDVDPFLFYVLTERDDRGDHLLGYFSKEKESADGYNVACILTLPQHQRKGYGRLLIEFSYALTLREGTVGSPEKPLSDLGLLSYRRYWCETIVAFLMEHGNPVPADADAALGGAMCTASIDQISRATGITTDDILHTLQAMDALRYHRGQHVVVLSQKHIADYEKARPRAGRGAGARRGPDTARLHVDLALLRWTPPVFTSAQLRFL